MPARLPIAMFALLAMIVPAFAVAADESSSATIDLTPSVGPNDLARVTLELTAGGTMKVLQENGRSSETFDMPTSAAAILKYDEHRFEPASGRHATRSVRYYNEAEAVLKVEAGGRTLQLSDDRRLLVATNPGGRMQIVSPRSLLERDELDLVDATGDSLTVDWLLPEQPVADGDSWSHDTTTMAGLLSIDRVAHCEVKSVLDKHNGDFALARMAGTVMGVVDGSTTELDVRGVWLFDRRLRRITKLNLAVKETRAIGGATPGLDSVAKLKLTIQPLASSSHLDPETRAAHRAPIARRLDLLQLVAHDKGYRVIHDRGWFITGSERETTTLRRVEGGDLVAHCTITRLPAKSEGRHTTLEEFENDIRTALGKNFGQLVASRQWTNAFKHRCLEVVARGTTEEVPVEWHYYLVFPESGHRVSVAVTIDGQQVARLGTADRKLVNAIQLLPTATAGQAPVRHGESSMGRR